MDDLDRLVASRFRELLTQTKVSREAAARAMTALGFGWSANRVTQVATGRRPLSLAEIAGVCNLFAISIADLIGDAEAVGVPGGSVATSGIRSALSGRGDWSYTPDRQTSPAKTHPEATVKAARRLRTSPDLVAAGARSLWGQDLASERDERVAAVEGESPRALQARRGHVTRHLIQELRAADY